MEDSQPEESDIASLRSELDAACGTIASLTSMLDRALLMLEKATDSEATLTTEDLFQTDRQSRIEGTQRLSYVNPDELSRMLGCSKATASKYMREAGAASIGTKLIAKKSTMIDFTEKTGKTIG